MGRAVVNMEHVAASITGPEGLPVRSTEAEKRLAATLNHAVRVAFTQARTAATSAGASPEAFRRGEAPALAAERIVLPLAVGDPRMPARLMAADGTNPTIN